MGNETNNETMGYFKEMASKLSSLPETTTDIDKNKFIKNKTRLFDTGKEARMDARLGDMAQNKQFDESQTPPEELVTLDTDLIDGLVTREINYITED